ncbi:solute carrier family 25 member 35-like isoform X3 [Dermacentor andersoni]|uniref:solute carrier family 25 member 35-like isoform X3 n=1 Tax=Dermacentor andersoni TaxID=34620 RepID=UPI003B3BB131
MEFLLGGLAACGAGFFTNPLEVVKTRIQLQGELQARGHYTVHYRNVFHAFYAIGKHDGLRALQSGLSPALWYQFFMNGTRLGAYHIMEDLQLTKNKNGSINVPCSIAAGAVAGCVGAFVGSPLYLVKVQLQAQSATSIAVGYQHNHEGMLAAFLRIYRRDHLRGLWRGVNAALLRVSSGSAVQLTTFSKIRSQINHIAACRHEGVCSNPGSATQWKGTHHSSRCDSHACSSCLRPVQRAVPEGPLRHCGRFAVQPCCQQYFESGPGLKHSWPVQQVGWWLLPP